MNGIDPISIGSAGISPSPLKLGGAEKAAEGEDFAKLVEGLIKDVDKAQRSADSSIKGLTTGETTNIQDVVTKLEEADVAFQLMKEVRNKLLDAYKEVMSQST
ncbi:MAG: flagellar hook-basal body complex protein FliE [Verrucomicrobiota bacterium]|jgi:flagellar hook-basal body complex protein FliE